MNATRPGTTLILSTLALLASCSTSVRDVRPPATPVEPASLRLAPETAAAAPDLAPPVLRQAGRGAIEVFREAHDDFFRGSVADPLVQLRATWMPEAEINSEPGEFDSGDLVLDATVPLPLDRDSFLVVGALAGARRLTFDGVQTIADEELYHIGPRLGFGRFFSDDFVVSAYWEPSIYSDLDGTLNSDDYKLWYGTALAVYRQSEELFWKVGFKLTDAVDTGVLPLGGVSWHFSPRWSLEVLLPRNADIRYRPDDSWTYSAGYLARSDEFHVRGPADIGKPEHDIHVQELVLFVGADYRFDQHLSSALKVGTLVAGEHDWGYGDGQPKFDGTLGPSLFLEWRLGWRF